MIDKNVDVRQRTDAQIREHYMIEKELASKLRNASGEDRRHLYTSLYDEMFKRIPHHPQLTRKSSEVERDIAVQQKMFFLRQFLDKNFTFLEIGPGDCSLSFEVSKHVHKVYAVDVSDEITKGLEWPDNFQLMLSGGCNIPLPTNSVHLVYSNQLIEHLHPDDAVDQLRNIYDVLLKGHCYVCITPNKLNGPHDISEYFDTESTGFHLKEYSISELFRLFKEAGFSKICIYSGVKNIYVRVPLAPILCLENILTRLSHETRKAVGTRFPLKQLLGINIVAIK